MFLFVFGGIAGALDLTHYNKVRIWNDNDYDNLSRLENYDSGYNYELYPALHIQQSRPNSPYWVDRGTKNPANGANDAVPLLVEAGIDNTYASNNPLSSILIIRNHGYSANSPPTFSFNTQTGEWEVDQDVRWSELRFDNGACNLNDSGDCDGDTGYLNAGVNTWGNDRILRLRPYVLLDNWQPASYVGRGEVRIKNFRGNLAARIVALSDKSASLEFVKGPDDKRFMEDSHSSVVTTSRIYRPAGSDDLRINLNGIGDLVTLQGGTGNFGIGTSEPFTPFALNAGVGGEDVGITQVKSAVRIQWNLLLLTL